MCGWVRVSVTVERNYTLSAQATVYKENIAFIFLFYVGSKVKSICNKPLI